MTTPEYDELVAARAASLLRLAVMLTGRVDEAEELLQHTFLKAQRQAGRIVGMGAPAAYLRQVMLHEHVSTLRRIRRSPRTGPPDALERLAARDDLAEVERRDEMWRTLAGLPRKQRAVLVLRFYEDLPDSEIAVLLECSEVTVRSQASRALATLRARLTPSSTTDPEVTP